MLSSRLINDIPYYLQLMRMDKPIGTLLLLWPTLCALWVAASGALNSSYVWVFVLGVVVMRSAGCVINDYADRDIDSKVERTKNRPLAASKLQPKQALGLFVGLGLCALVLLFMLPVKVWPWSIPAVMITIAYPYMKRFIEAPQLVLGVAFSFGIPMVFVTFNKAFDLIFCLLFLSNFVWVLVYDTQYAMSDREDDLAIGVKSTAIYFGAFDRLIVGILQVLMLCLWLVLMPLLQLDSTFYVALVLVAVLFAYQQWLIKDRERLSCFAAFLNNSWVGGILWFGLMIAKT